MPEKGEALGLHYQVGRTKCVTKHELRGIVDGRAAHCLAFVAGVMRMAVENRCDIVEAVERVETVGMLKMTSTKISPRVIRANHRTSTISTSYSSPLKWERIFRQSPAVANTSTSFVGRTMPVWAASA